MRYQKRFLHVLHSIGQLCVDLWDGLRDGVRATMRDDEWQAWFRWGRPLLGALILFSAVYFALMLRYGVVVHPPYPAPGLVLERNLANAIHAVMTAPVQTLASWLWRLLVAIVGFMFLWLFMLSIETGLHSTARRRQERHREQDAALWGQALRDAGVDDL